MIFAANVNWLRGKYYYTLAVLSVFLLFFIHTMIRLTYDVHFEAFLELKVSLLLKKPIKNSFLRSTFSNIRFVSISSSGIYTKWSLRRFQLSKKLQFWKVKTSDFGKRFLKMRSSSVIGDLIILNLNFFDNWKWLKCRMAEIWWWRSQKWFVEIFEKRATCGRQMSRITKKHEFLNFCMTLLLLRFINRFSPDLTDQNWDILTTLALKIIMTYQFLYQNRLVQRLWFSKYEQCQRCLTFSKAVEPRCRPRDSFG